MSAGAMGGGISSAIARALGAGRRADADALVLHALAVGLCFGIAFGTGDMKTPAIVTCVGVACGSDRGICNGERSNDGNRSTPTPLRPAVA